MFRVKICGIRSLEDLNAAIDSGADAVGLNFYSAGKRFLDPATSQAKSLSSAAAGKVIRVGLFVNATIEFVRQTLNSVPLDAIQAHGTEDAAWFLQARELGLPLIRAIRCPDTAEALRALIEKVPAEHYDMLLIDGVPSGSTPADPIYGGSGATANWRAIQEIRTTITHPLILAGGLTPRNVADAILMVTPDGVDVASGVESPNGGKNADKVMDFTEGAQDALIAIKKW